jgi:hypothetical protein
MPLRGSAFLAIWHDIRADSEPEYNLWHTREHMPERLGISGFLVGRRYVNWDLGLHRYFTLYEGEHPETFRSPAYIERLNNPTPWSNRMQPAFLNFVRGACRTTASVGMGIGGALLTARLHMEHGVAVEPGRLCESLNAILDLPGAVGAHYGAAALDITSVKTRETELRKQSDSASFDGVLMVEAIGRREIDGLADRIASIAGTLPGLNRIDAEVYELAYMLIGGE